MSSPISTILAGETVEATLLNGVTVAVRVRQMPVRHLFDTLAVMHDEAALLDKVCIAPTGTILPDGWVDGLTEASHLALVEKARELNFSRAVALCERTAPVSKQIRSLSERTISSPSSSTTAR